MLSAVLLIFSVQFSLLFFHVRQPGSIGARTWLSDVAENLGGVISYHITELTMALIHQSSVAPYVDNTIVINSARLHVES